MAKVRDDDEHAAARSGDGGPAAPHGRADPHGAHCAPLDVAVLRAHGIDAAHAALAEMLWSALIDRAPSPPEVTVGGGVKFSWFGERYYLEVEVWSDGQMSWHFHDNTLPPDRFEGDVDDPVDRLPGRFWDCLMLAGALSAKVITLRALYEDLSTPEVVAHLHRHPELIPVLLEAAPRLKGAYGSGARLRLEAAFLSGAEMFVQIYGHGLTVEETEVRTATFDAWWRAAAPELDAARRWLEFDVGRGAPRWR